MAPVACSTCRVAPCVCAALAAPKPENVVGRYVCVDALGKGGMGIVFRAYDTELRRWVAIKFMTALDDEDLKRFRREALVMARLQHPNIAQIYEVGEHNGRHFIVMQLIDGQSLARAKPADLDPVLEKFESVCRAVEYAHQQGIIHRDLKPDNIMIDKRGQVFVMDFGLARPQDVRTSMSRSGTVIGTPAFMAPEQAMGKSGDIDALSDVYGLGATLYWIATGKLPFQSPDVYETLLKVVNVEPEPPRKINPTLPADVETIILKAMAKEKSRRYPSASALADDLVRYRVGEAITARPTSVVYKIRKKITKNPIVSAALAVAGLAFLFVAVDWIRGSSQANTYARQGARAYHAKDFKTAKEFFDQAIALGVDDPVVLQRRDECEARLDAMQKAAAFQPFVDLARDHLEAARVLRYQPKWDAERFRSELGRARAACDKAPGFAPALLLRGQTLVEEGKFKEGVDEMERAAPSDPIVGRACLTWYLFEKLADRDAEFLRRKAEALLPDSTAEGLFVRGRYSELDGSTGATKEMQPLLRGIAYLDQGKPRDAVESLKQAAAIGLGSRLVWLWTARALIEAKMFPEGRTASEKVVELDPENPMAHLYRGILNTETLLTKEALADLNRAIELRPDYAEALRYRGLVHYRLKRLAEAIRDYDRALSLSPRHAEALLVRGMAKYENGDAAGGEADFKEAFRLDPKLETQRNEEIALARTHASGGDSMVWMRRGQALWRERQAQPALEAFTKAVEIDAANAWAYFGRGVVWRHLGELRKALADYDAALRLDPKLADAYLNRSSVRSELNDFEGAIRDCNALIALDPRSAGAYNNRATCRYMTGDVKGAVEDCTRALELAPGNADALSNRGKYRGQLGDLKGSFDDLTEAIRARPTDPLAHLDRGVTLAGLGKMEEAMRDFTRAIELKPDYAMAYRNRGIGYYNARRYVEALRDFEKAVELEPRLEPSLRENIADCRRRTR